MNTAEVTVIARELMDFHGLQDWTIAFDGAKKRAGVCYYNRKLLSFSKFFAEVSDEAAVRNTILHEIAHALVGGYHGHDGVWRRKFIAIGGNGEAQSQASSALAEAIHNSSKYRATCSGCGEVYTAQRRKKSFGFSMCSEATCPVSYPKTRFTENHVYLVWVDTATNNPVPIS